MRQLIKSQKKLPEQSLKVENGGKKITFRCDIFLLEKVKNTLTSQHLAGNYQYPNLSTLIRLALQAYQEGMPLTYQRETNYPKKEISFRLTDELLSFYQTLSPYTKTLILERSLGSYYYQYLT